VSDFLEHRPVTKGNLEAVARELRADLALKGAAWFRAKILDPDGDAVLVVEGWRAEPEDEGPEPTIADIFPEGRS
jgi:hypothetical protein